MKDKTRAISFATAACALSLGATRAEAHELGLSRGEYRVRGELVTAEVTFARRELTAIVAGLDRDHDERLTEEEIESASSAIEASLVRQISIHGDGAPCAGRLIGARLVDEDGLDVRMRFECPAPPAKLVFDFPVLEKLARGHRHVAHVEAGQTALDHVAHSRNPSFEIDVASGELAGEPRSNGAIAGSFFVSGIEHIVTGIDHLAFLFGLILVGGRMRSILMMVTAFTVAHSITLALAVLGVWSPSSRLVEPAIALSVAYVGVENWFVKVPDKRWRITFPFGLVHGFGFAGALGRIALPRPQIPLALVTFNLGVEVGQLALLAIALPLVLLARQHEWFKATGVKALSTAVALGGAVWFVARVASG